MNMLTATLIALTVVVLIFVVRTVEDHRARKILLKWAGSAGVTVSTVERERYHMGRFQTRWKGQVVLRFEGVEKNGSTIRGSAMCGNMFGVIFNNEIEIDFP